MQVGKAASWPRKALVVAQFSCSIALILSAVIVFQQIQHAKNRPTGFDVNRLMMTNMNSELGANFTILKDELAQERHRRKCIAVIEPGYRYLVAFRCGEMAGQKRR